MTRDEFKLILIAEIKRNCHHLNADKAEAIINHLLTLPVMQDEENLQPFIDSYRKQVAERSIRGIQR